MQKRAKLRSIPKKTVFEGTAEEAEVSSSNVEVESQTIDEKVANDELGEEGNDNDDAEENQDGDVDGEGKKRKRKRKRKAVTEAAEGASSTGAVAKTSGGPTQENAFVNSRTIYIEGLPFTAADDDVRRFFQEFGTIVSVRLPRWHDSGRLRGYGHVEFTTTEAAQKAFEMDGCDFFDSGRYLKISSPMCPRALQNSSSSDKGAAKVVAPTGCKCVFVKNLPYDVTEEAMTEAFKVCGPVAGVRLAVWGHTQQLKGFGYVEFKREDSAAIAVKKSGSLAINGRPLLIDFETGAPKGSFKAKK